MNSILQENKDRCYLCGLGFYHDPPEWHHVFFGSANRQLSDEDGLTVRLHGYHCHRSGKHAVHKDAETDRMLKRVAQKKWMEYYGKTEDDFRERYGKSYL